MKMMFIILTILFYGQSFAQNEGIKNKEYLEALKEASQDKGFDNDFKEFAKWPFDDISTAYFLKDQIRRTENPILIGKLIKLTGKLVKHTKDYKAATMVLTEVNIKRPKDGSWNWNKPVLSTKEWNGFLTDLIDNKNELTTKKGSISYHANKINSMAMFIYDQAQIRDDSNVDKNEINKMAKKMIDSVKNDPSMSKEVMQYLSNLSSDKETAMTALEGILAIGQGNEKDAMEALNHIDYKCFYATQKAKEGLLSHVKEICKSKEFQNKLAKIVETVKDRDFDASSTAPDKILQRGDLAVSRSEKMSVAEWFERFKNHEERAIAKNNLLDSYYKIMEAYKKTPIGELKDSEKQYCSLDMVNIVQNAIKEETGRVELSKEDMERVSTILEACSGAEQIAHFANVAAKSGIKKNDEQRLLDIFLFNSLAPKNKDDILPDSTITNAFSY